MAEVTTIGLDIAKQVFTRMEQMRAGERYSAVDSRAASCSTSSRPIRGVWWRWKHAAARITGRASCGRWATRFG